MKLNIFNSLFGLCVAFAAVSCSNDQVIDDLRPAGGNDSDMISFMVADDYTRGGSFGNRPGSSTRTSVTTSDNIINNSFAVYGNMKNFNSSNSIALFRNEPVSYKNGDWTYSNTRYWFPDREYSFLAIHPSSVIPNETGSTNGELTNFEYKGDASVSFDYTSPSDYSMATDILIAGHRRKYTSTTEVKTVELSFGHIMSRLNFVAETDNSKIEIKNITIKEIASEASYSVKPDDIRSGSETSDLTGSAWTTPSKPIQISKVIGADNIVSTIDSETSKKSMNLFPDNYPLIVIPQNVTGDMVVEVTYTTDGKNFEKIEGNLDSASIYNWIAGKLYTYTFTIGSNDYILFGKPTVDDLNEAEGASYIIMD